MRKKEGDYTDEYILSAALQLTDIEGSSTISVRSLRWYILVQMEGKNHSELNKCQRDTGLTGGRISKILMAHPEYFSPVFRTPHIDRNGYIHNRVARFTRTDRTFHLGTGFMVPGIIQSSV